MDLLEKINFENGISISFFNSSRPLAGDRWLVELNCEVSCPFGEKSFSLPTEDNPALGKAIVEKLGTCLSMQVRRSRNFVDAQDKDGVMAELLEQLKKHQLPYFASPRFPEKLFARNWQQLKEQCQQQLWRDAANSEREACQAARQSEQSIKK